MHCTADNRQCNRRTINLVENSLLTVRIIPVGLIGKTASHGSIRIRQPVSRTCASLCHATFPRADRDSGDRRDDVARADFGLATNDDLGRAADRDLGELRRLRLRSPLPNSAPTSAEPPRSPLPNSASTSAEPSCRFLPNSFAPLGALQCASVGQQTPVGQPGRDLGRLGRAIDNGRATDAGRATADAVVDLASTSVRAPAADEVHHHG